jgi:hypothetical protein
MLKIRFAVVKVWVSHKSITSRSGKRPVTDATRIRCLNCPGRKDVARRMNAVMGLSVRIDDESRMILREWVASLLKSLRTRVPCCSRKKAHTEKGASNWSTALSLEDRYISIPGSSASSTKCCAPLSDTTASCDSSWSSNEGSTKSGSTPTFSAPRSIKLARISRPKFVELPW